jgi:hypothetical protein
VKFVEQPADDNENIISTLRHLAEMLEADGKVVESQKLLSQTLALHTETWFGDALSSEELGSLALKAALRRVWAVEQAATDDPLIEYQPSASFRYSMVAASTSKPATESHEQFCKRFCGVQRRPHFLCRSGGESLPFKPSTNVDLNAIGRLAIPL